MCWSKRSQEDEGSKPTTTRKPMDSKIKCPEGSNECGKEEDMNHCSDHGLCCLHPDSNSKSCVCRPLWEGTYCQDSKLPEFSRDFQRTTTIAIFSAILGVIVITLFVALIVLQIKYYRMRKIRRRQLASGDHDPKKITKPDSKKRLPTQPGYSWRESVRRTHSKASHKFRSTLSRSVPDDLFQVGLKLAIFGGCPPNLSPSGPQSAVGKAEVKAVTTHRCFSAGPDLGDGQTTSDRKDNTNASNRPIVVQMTTAGSGAETTATITEDTVL